MTDESLFQLTINTVNRVAPLIASSTGGNGKKPSGGEDYFREMVRALSFYLCTIQKNHYYTETYLPDQYQEFEKFMHLFNDKQVFVNGLKNYLTTYSKLFDEQEDIDVRILIDNVWCIQFKDRKWSLEIVANGDCGRLAGNTLYCSYEITDGNDIVEMYKEIEFKPLDRDVAFKNINEDISKYLKAIRSAE